MQDFIFSMTVAILAIILYAILPSINGHGRLIEPPSRASAWRYGFDTPHNYNDHELYCGGYTRQWVKNGGNCGVCGDPWDSKYITFNLFFKIHTLHILCVLGYLELTNLVELTDKVS